MTKFLVQGSYTPDGAKGILKVGGTNRREAIEKMFKDLGGQMESFYYAFGNYDVYVIGEMPDTESITAISLAINATGLVSVSTTILIKPEDVDKAIGKAVNYRKPGS